MVETHGPRGKGYLHIDYSEEIAETQEEENAETRGEEIVETQDETLAALANDSCSEKEKKKLRKTFYYVHILSKKILLKGVIHS